MEKWNDAKTTSQFQFAQGEVQLRTGFQSQKGFAAKLFTSFYLWLVGEALLLGKADCPLYLLFYLFRFMNHPTPEYRALENV